MLCFSRPERERNHNACKLCLVSYLNKCEDGMQAVADHVCYALAGLRVRLQCLCTVPDVICYEYDVVTCQ